MTDLLIDIVEIDVAASGEDKHERKHQRPYKTINAQAFGIVVGTFVVAFAEAPTDENARCLRQP